MKPVIGIVCGFDAEHKQGRYYVNRPYIRAVAAAGGIPVLIAETYDAEALSAVFALVDGIVLPGGVDVDPARYGQQRHPNLGQVVPEWDALDVTAAELALARDVPLLGICRGMQVLNVAAGGTLIQDIPAQVAGALAHSQEEDRSRATHDVTIAPKTKLAEIFGAEAPAHTVGVNSFHHQAVQDVAPGFIVTALAKDNIIEAIESTRHRFALGVQWHPEAMTETEPIQAQLFAALVAAARNGKEGDG